MCIQLKHTNTYYLFILSIFYTHISLLQRFVIRIIMIKLGTSYLQKLKDYYIYIGGKKR